MSPKLKQGLIIGGIVLGVVVLCGVIGGLVILPRTGGLGARSAPEAMYYDEGYYPEEPMAGAPAMEEMAVEAEQAFDFAEPLPAATMVANAGTDTQTGQQIERLIIRNGNITVTVENTRVAKQAVEQMVAGLAAEGAFIVSSNESGSAPDSSPYINMSIRVPATRFDEVMDALAGLAVEGTSPTVSESAQDVTEEYVDVQARVESMEAARDRLLDLMANAQTTEDLLMAEQQLTMREAEIESLKGRMRYLTESARLSRIDIALQPYILSQPVDTRWRPAETVREAFEALIDGLRGFADFLIFFAIAVLPWLALFGLVIYAIVRFIIGRVRAAQRRRAAHAATPED